MERLRLSLLGDFSIRHGDSKTQICLARRLQVLLAYLLLNPNRVHPREEVLEAIWPDVEFDRARGRLNTALWRLRQTLEPAGLSRGTYLFTSRRGDVGFNWASEHVLDTQVFETSIQSALATPPERLNPEAAEGLMAAFALYQGDLLPGNYEDWIIRERERLRTLYIDGLSYCLRYCGMKGDYARALQCGRSILDLDLLREEIHREMMRLYVKSGQRARALRQYEACCDILQRELGIGPMEETEALYSEIRQAEAAPGAGEAREALALSIGDVLLQMKEAISSFKNAELALRKVAPLVESIENAKPNQRS